MAKMENTITKSVFLSLELYPTDNGFGIYLGDENGGSGISVYGNTPTECVENISPYIEDYFYSNEESI
jgi:hypothetical protein